MKKFDFYEFTGILLPGAVLIFGLTRIYPALTGMLNEKEFTLGEFGLFVILAYAAGHIIQTLGNAIDYLWWRCCGGMPSDWIRTEKRELISTQQLQLVRAQIQQILRLDCPDKLSDISRDGWYSITRQIYAAIKRAGAAERVDIFNGNYGMFRGISASLIVILIASILESWPINWRLVGILAAASLCSPLRMHRFGVIYAREMFIQFISLKPNDSIKAEKDKETE